MGYPELISLMTVTTLDLEAQLSLPTKALRTTTETYTIT